MSTGSIADSSAASVERVLSHHQAAITVLANVLFPRMAGSLVDWLDLACGKGQIIAHLQDALPDEQMRSQISFVGFDIENKHVRETERLAKELNFGAVDGVVGELGKFSTLFDSDRSFSFITFTNTVHEVPPILVGSLLLHSILRLTPVGILYIADMESLSPLELGAIPWDSSDVKRVVDCLYRLLDSKRSPIVQRWQHTSRFAWTVQIERSHFDATRAQLLEKLPALEVQLSEFIVNLFREKHERTNEQLEELTEFGGGETGEEIDTRLRLLYEHWSLSRFLRTLP